MQQEEMQNTTVPVIVPSIKNIPVEKTKTPTQPTSEVKVVNSMKEVRALTDKTNGLSEDTNDYLYIQETFNEIGYKAIQVKKGRFSYLMSVNMDGVIEPLNITDLRSGKKLQYAKAFDGAGNPIKSSVDFPINEAQKGIKEVQNLTQKTLSQPEQQTSEVKNPLAGLASIDSSLTENASKLAASPYNKFLDILNTLDESKRKDNFVTEDEFNAYSAEKKATVMKQIKKC